jgi:two-component system phosphate regulon sensor histidine kinase PhoR
MKGSISFKVLLILAVWGLLTFTMVLPSWYAYTRLDGALDTEASRRLIRQLHQISTLTTQEEFESVEQLQRWLVQTSLLLELRLTYVAKNGQVLADTDIPFDRIKELEDFSGRPEIAQALHGELGFMIRFSKRMQREQIFAAKSIQPKGNIPPGVLRVAAPVNELHTQLDRLRNLFLLMLLLAFTLSPLIGMLLVNRLKKFNQGVADAIDALAEGDFGQRIRVSQIHEFYLPAHSFNRMTERIGNRLQTLTAELRWLETVFNAMGEGVMVLDPKGRVRSINRSLAELIDPHTQALGRYPLEVLISLELQKACERILGLKEAPSESSHEVLTIVHAGRTFEVNVFRFQDQDQDQDQEQETGAVLVFHDMSRIKELEQVRQDFVANVSHELRTPLTSIKGYTETLLAESEPQPEVLSSFLQVILKNTNHMVRMVDDLLQLARIESGREMLKSARVNPVEALTAAWKACLPLAQVKQVRLASHLPPEGIDVWADSDQLARVFRNLLENAIRYSPEGGDIVVDCSVASGTVTIGLCNDGPRISKHHQKRIFERFYRIEKSRVGDFGGTGLGLAICRHIILSHGGLIWVQSPNPDRTDGATFFFTLLSAEEP